MTLYMVDVRSDKAVFIYRSVLLHLGTEKLARPLRGGAVIVTVRCRITALQQVVIRVAEV